MEMETETETESDEDMEMETMVFEVTEIDLEYEFDASRWFDFTREELSLESRAAELWFETAQSYPPSPFAMKLLMKEESFSDEKTESLSKSEDGEVIVDVQENDREISQQPDVNETGNGMRSGVFTFIQGGGTLNKVPNQSLLKGPTFSNRIHSDKLKCRPKSSIRPIPRSSTLMKPTASLLAKQDNARMQVDEIKCPSSEIQSAKRQKLDGGLLRKVAEATQETNLVHKTLKKDLDRNSLHARMKITVPQEPDFATSHRANRIRHKGTDKLDQDSTSVYRFKARPLNRKIFDGPSLPIRKNSTPKLPEFQEFRLKTSERAMQHSSAVSTPSYQGTSYRKESDKPNRTAFLDGVNREPRRPRAMDIPKDDDRKHLFKARPLNNKILSSGRDIGIFGKSKRETTAPLTQTQGFSFHSERRAQPDLPTDLFSKLSLSSELRPNNGSRLRFPQPEQVKVSKENRLNSFQAGNERTSKFTGKPMVQHGVVPETSRQWTSRSGKLEATVQLN
ncbi:protein TPX2 isoform X2 [Arabidopsis lyrata subsp. lyrata]|uniref:protein TPX2 isoform X2 n=1 Tax=Arabidopsis lyrata subsp. lyrata TaxID=81972 RepID=UPI000A29C649|nr:protein TPX2 isoform X2 [Arabidopsis lyrata subsp. lyrata]|eukprot:XP_020877670.1 protein TPX2 isoform X2 [Arabidopsis lyrata subsp. lyrata]